MNTLSTAAHDHRINRLIVVGILSALLLLCSIVLIVYYLRKRSDGRTQRTEPNALTPSRLVQVWERFLAPLPAAVRAVLPEYDHFIVMGDPGAGKSAVISRRVDWQAQASLFLPSYTPDPLLQVYIGSRMVVEEISATLLQSTSRVSHEAFRKLWKASLHSANPPTVVIPIKMTTLSITPPDVLRQQALLIRGKINLLSEMLSTPIRTRLCVTHMDRIRGYSEFARFLCKHRLPLTIEVGTDTQTSLVAALQAYEKYVPRALTTLPVGAFEASISLLSAAEAVMTPVRAFITALGEGSVASVRPDVQRVYFFSLASDEQVGNPFENAGVAAGNRFPTLSRWLRRLGGLGIRPLHALLSMLILLIGLVPLFLAVRSHSQRVARAEAAVTALESSLRRAQESLSIPSESDVVRRAEQAAAAALAEVDSAETRLRPLRLLDRPDKATARQRFVDSVRQGYLRPALEAAVRKRARDKILYSLAVLYATRRNTLGTLVRSQPQDYADALGLPTDLVLDYVNTSETPWSERALLLLPPLPSEASRYPIADLRPWQEFVQAIRDAIPKPIITVEQLNGLRKESERLRATIDRVRQATVMRRIYQVLSEESPLDMPRLLGADVGALSPDPWLHDNTTTLDRLLKLVSESEISPPSRGRMSLYNLLKWINSFSASGNGPPRAAGQEAPDDEDRLVLAFPRSGLFEISERAWLELLMRTRKRLLLKHQISRAGKHEDRPRHHHRHQCCERSPRRSTKDARDAGDGKVVKGALDVQELPLFNEEEIRRGVFDNQVLPLLQELRKSLADSQTLTLEEKNKLTSRVRSQVTSYARRYCADLMKFHQSFHFHGGSDLRTGLLNVVKPGSRFVAHLQTVADNAAPGGLTDPFLSPLADCLSEFTPLVRVLKGDGDKKDADKKVADKKDSDNKDGDKKDADKQPEAEGLSAYLDAVAKQAEALDPSAARGLEEPAKEGDKKGGSERKAVLAEQLGPAGRSALQMATGAESTPRRQAEEFLDKAGIVGPLRRPFMEPFESVYRRGAAEIERTLAAQWQNETLPRVASLLGRFPFSPAADREVAPSELDLLSETTGGFWQDVRGFFGPMLSEQGGTYKARAGVYGTIALPRDFLPTVNQLARLARALFAPNGSRQPLRFSVRHVPGERITEEYKAQATVAFIRIGKSAVYGFNQRASADTLSVEWWNQGVAMVGIENQVAKSGRKHTQTLEVADSAWGLYRLLQKSTLEAEGLSTWRILDDNGRDGHAIRFVFQPDPWALFRIKLPGGG